MTTKSLIMSNLNHESLVLEPWTDAKLYQPYIELQILLAEYSSCLAVKAFLRMCNLKYTDETRPNAEFISPGGHTTKLPVLCVGAFVVSEFEPIASLVEKKGISLTRDMDADLKADLRAFLSLVEKIFSLAELYITWMNESVLPITLERNGAVYPWILKQYQNWRKRRQVIKLLRIHEWDKMNMDEVVDMVDKMCKNLSDKLGNNQYFYGDQPSELDALVFGHYFANITANLPDKRIENTLRKYDNLIKHCQRIDKKYFPSQ